MSEPVNNDRPQAHSGLERRTLFKYFAGAGVLLASGALLSACGDDATAEQTTPDQPGSGQPSPSDGPEEKRGGSARIVLTQPGTGDALDPLKARNARDGLLVELFFSPLLVLDENNEASSNDRCICESWEVAPDAKEITFKIRQGVVFSDGKPLTSADVAYSMRRHLDKESQSALYGRLSLSLTPESIETPSASEVRVTLLRPDALLPTALTGLAGNICQDGATDFTMPVGTGPFRLTSWQGDGGFLAERNPHYWRSELPYLDELSGVVIPDDAAKVRELLSGEADFVDSIPFSLIEQINDSSDAQVAGLDNGYIYLFAVDTGVEPFDDVRVVQALKLATDRPMLADIAFGGAAAPTGDVTEPPASLYFPAQTLIERDLDRARSLLTEAGYPDGIDLELFASERRSGIINNAVTWVGQLKEAGIRVKITEVPATQYSDTVWMKKPFFTSTWVRQNPIEMANISLVSTAPSNESRFNNPEFDSLIAEAVTIADSAKRQEVGRQAFELASLNSGWIIPNLVSPLCAMKNRLNGVNLVPTTMVDFSEAWLS